MKPCHLLTSSPFPLPSFPFSFSYFHYSYSSLLFIHLFSPFFLPSFLFPLFFTPFSSLSSLSFILLVSAFFSPPLSFLFFLLLVIHLPLHISIFFLLISPLCHIIMTLLVIRATKSLQMIDISHYICKHYFSHLLPPLALPLKCTVLLYRTNKMY